VSDILLDINHIWIFLTGICKSPQYEILGKLSSGSHVDTCGRRDGANRRYSLLMSMCLKPTILLPERKKVIHKDLRPGCIENRHRLVIKMMYMFEIGRLGVKTWKK